jgi:hypothetical protein
MIQATTTYATVVFTTRRRLSSDQNFAAKEKCLLSTIISLRHPRHALAMILTSDIRPGRAR